MGNNFFAWIYVSAEFQRTALNSFPISISVLRVVSPIHVNFLRTKWPCRTRYFSTTIFHEKTFSFTKRIDKWKAKEKWQVYLIFFFTMFFFCRRLQCFSLDRRMSSPVLLSRHCFFTVISENSMWWSERYSFHSQSGSAWVDGGTKFPAGGKENKILIKNTVPYFLYWFEGRFFFTVIRQSYEENEEIKT